jgi:hypothetical protein
VPDCSLAEALDGGKATFDAIVLPGETTFQTIKLLQSIDNIFSQGGLKGAENLAASEAVKKILTDQVFILALLQSRLSKAEALT